MDSTLREAYEPRVWDSNPSPACAKPVSVDALFPSAGKWFLEAETRPSQAGPRGRHFGLSGRAFSLPAGNPPEMTAILRRSGCASNSGRMVGGGRSRAKPVSADRARLGNRKKDTRGGRLTPRVRPFAQGVARRGAARCRRLVVSPGRAPDANTWETAVVVLALALVVAGAQTVFRVLRRRAPTPSKPA